jgi:hypothetical protein
MTGIKHAHRQPAAMRLSRLPYSRCAARSAASLYVVFLPYIQGLSKAASGEQSSRREPNSFEISATSVAVTSAKSGLLCCGRLTYRHGARVRAKPLTNIAALQHDGARARGYGKGKLFLA